MKKIIILGFTLLIIIITTLGFTTIDQPPYKNLKILPQDISKQKLDSIMHNFSMSLNVRCNFCHLRNEKDKSWDFASDSLGEKLITRKMMMMTMDINKKYFKPEEEDMNQENKVTAEMIQSVACYTCHRGSAQPQTIPPPPPPRLSEASGKFKDSTKRSPSN